jgi:MYXO-CTERM domain-containing protein
VDGFAFNTDLNLAASQISLPAGWTLTRNGQIDGFGTFSWVAMASNVQSFVNFGTITIDGLGSDAIPAHFKLTSQATPGAPSPSGMVYAGIHLSGLTPSALDKFATEHWIGVAMLQSPEPGSLSLAVLGLGALALVRTLRRRSSFQW